jgi:cation transport ATPase
LLVEKQSEHPLAKAVVNKITSLIPSRIEEFTLRYKVKEFKNRDGEGVTATITDAEGENLLVACGNDKLMDSQQVDFSGVSSS